MEEKNQQERERNLALELERNNNSINNDIKNKGKGKKTMEVLEDSSDFNKDEESPIKKTKGGRRRILGAQTKKKRGRRKVFFLKIY